MADEHKAKRLEIAHVLFMDIVGYSKLLTDEQSEALQELNQIVRSTEAAREAEAAGQLTILPTGDGMALVFTGSVEEPVECALEISQALRAQPSLPVRMGIHSGPIHQVKDASGRENIAGVGINIAQRVMDCGDAGHILVSKRIADDLAQQRRWQPYLHELGDVEVKHGVVVSLVNLYAETIGNPTPPSRLGKVRGSARTFSKATRKGLSPLARAIFIIVGLLMALIFLLAIVSVIFAPAIMRTLDKGRSAALPQPSATTSPSLADTIKSAVAKKITDELHGELSRKKNAAVAPSTTGSAVPEKSIAVLPLLNESGDPKDEYFSDGLSEELIAALAQISGLKVIGRSSSFRFKDRKEDSKTIGEKLGVSTLLEGTVRKQGDRVRIVAELVNVADGIELWTRTFDRELKDIFAVQEEIARAVADSLKVTLLGSNERSAQRAAPNSVEAHNAYLLGHYHFQRRNLDDYRKAVSYFDEAIRIDPDYALAYAERSEAWTFIADLSIEQREEARAAAKNDAEKAVAAGPNLAEAHAALGWVRFFSEWKFAEGLRELRRANELAPANPTANDLLARVVVYLGQVEEAEKLARRAIELDPLAFVARGNLARILLAEGKLDEADAEARKAAELQPTGAAGRRWQVLVAIQHGDGEAALREAQLEPDEGYRRFELALAHYVRGDRKAADAALADLIAFGRNQLAYQIAEVYAVRGETDKAFEWLQISFDNHDTGTLSLLVDPLMRGLRDDPRYKSLLAKLGLPETS